MEAAPPSAAASAAPPSAAAAAETATIDGSMNGEGEMKSGDEEMSESSVAKRRLNLRVVEKWKKEARSEDRRREESKSEAKVIRAESREGRTELILIKTKARVM